MTHARVALFEAPNEKLTVVDVQVGPLAEDETNEHPVRLGIHTSIERK